MIRAQWFITMLICLFTLTLVSKPIKFVKERHQMVEKQLVKRNIKDVRVLNVMKRVRRHEFVPLIMKPFAYTDRPLSIGEDQTISQPYIVAFMTEAAMLKSSDRVLEIGTGSGYQAAVLAGFYRDFDGRCAANIALAKAVETRIRRVKQDKRFAAFL